MPDKNPVSIPSRYWESKQPMWQLIDTLIGGTEAMRAAGKEYLPREPKEPEAAYKNRLARSVLTPLYEDALRKMVGKLLKQPVQLDDDVPSTISRFEDDIDASGTDINEWTRRVAFNAMHHGVTYMLVDSPSARQIAEREGREVNHGDVVSGKFRPYSIMVTAPQVLGWKTVVVGGKVLLKQFRFIQTTMEDGGDEFSQVEVKRIHVWEIGRRRVYEEVKDSDGNVDWMLVKDDLIDLDVIPLVPVYGQHDFFMQGDPPLLEIAHLNIAHWQSDSDQRNILHVARVPILFGSGLGTEDNFELAVGPNSMTRGPQGSDLKFVEHSGTGIEAGVVDLETIERRIAKLGLNMILKQNTGDVTATARALDQSEADSPLGMFARHLEKSLESMLDLFALILGLGEDAGGGVTVYKDFSITMRDGEDIKALSEMRSRGDISQITYWAELKRRNLLSDDFNPDSEIDLLDLEYQDEDSGMSEADRDAGNKVGDETGDAEGHTHVLQANGWTNEVDGHRHKWEPTGAETSEADGHVHPLKGIADASIQRKTEKEETQLPE